MIGAIMRLGMSDLTRVVNTGAFHVVSAETCDELPKAHQSEGEAESVGAAVNCVESKRGDP